MTPMEFAYYPGCSVHGIARDYGRSVSLVSRRLGIRLREIDDWNCCGASAAHSLDQGLTLRLSARNLAIAARMKIDRLTTPCPGCFNRLRGCVRDLEASQELRGRMEEEVERPLPILPDVSHLLRAFVECAGLERISAEVTRPLKGLKLAAYYGCLLTRPRAIAGFDDPEQPTSLDRLLHALGAETVRWSHKAECCGGGFAASQTEFVVDLGGQILEAARLAGAEAVAVACPMCQINLDSRQRAVEEDRGTRLDLPVVYFTQLMGLACGFSFREMGLGKRLVSPLPLLRRKGLA